MEAEKEKPALLYIGAGAFTPGLPARDLTPAEVETYGGIATILATGLYVQPEEDEE